MKIKQNLFLKILVFLLALVFFAAVAASAIYQIANFNVLWEDDDPFYGYTCTELYRRDREKIEELVDLSGLESPGLYSQRRLEKLQELLSAERTNLRWRVTDRDSTIVYKNADSMPQWVEFHAYSIKVLPVGTCALTIWLDPELPVEDDYRTAVASLLEWKDNREFALAVTAGAFLLGVLCTIYLCVTCGHKKGVEGIYLNWFHHIPGDLLLALYVLGGALCLVGIVDSVGYSYGYRDWEFRWILTFATACAVGFALLLISFLVTLAARCKGRALLRNTFIGWILRWLWKLCKWLWRVCLAAAGAVPLIWKVALAGAAYIVLSLILTSLGWYAEGWMTLWAVLSVGLVAYLCWWAYQWKKVRQGAHEIIGGNTACRIEGFAMPSDLRGHADELNNLGQAIGAAVEERMKSEHFKAELITNVSHDLKTPLTSIISYVDLLKKEEIDNPKAQEYIEVLDRKSQRLKKLTEDLVEASKASTGAIGVSCERLDVVQLVDQALAEYEERFAAHSLSVVRTLPEYSVWVMADGRHLWRIMDNLLSNCAKYALEGTRVYIDVQRQNGCACLTVKNISRDEISLPAERLVERFVRGDDSRTLEGSGLGLSIAQSLAELQRGDFEISVDGDLFKASVKLPLAPETELL